ncbi:MAG: cation:proton antiporter [Acidobacteria bacterium]|nr:cation:proton antiporter [Acidobacteriota bacterium]
MAEALFGIGLLVFLSLAFSAIFKKTLIPDVLLLIVLGILLGPAVLGWVKPSDLGKVGGVLSTVALVVILFEGGTTLNIDLLKKMLKTTASLAGLTFVMTALVFSCLGHWLLGLNWMGSLVLGLIVGNISPAVALPIANSLDMREPTKTVLILETGLTDVLSIVLVFGMLNSPAGDLEAGKLIGSILSSLVMAGVIGVAGGLLWAAILNTLRQFPNTSFAVFAWIFILYGVADILGFSGAIAALAFGASLTNYQRLPLHNVALFRERNMGELSQTDMEFIHEVIFLLKTFFFVYLGMSIQFKNPVYLLLVLGAVVVVYTFRALIVRRVLHGVNPGWEESYEMSVMAPKGLAAAVLAGAPAERGMQGGDVIQSAAYFIVLVTITVTALLIPLMKQAAVGRVARAFFGFPEPAPMEPEATSY